METKFIIVFITIMLSSCGLKKPLEYSYVAGEGKQAEVRQVLYELEADDQ